MISYGSVEQHERMKRNRNGNCMSIYVIFFSYILNLFKTKLTG